MIAQYAKKAYALNVFTTSSRVSMKVDPSAVKMAFVEDVLIRMIVLRNVFAMRIRVVAYNATVILTAMAAHRFAMTKVCVNHAIRSRKTNAKWGRAV